METLEEIWGLHNETEEAVTTTGAGKTVSVRKIPASYLLLFKISQPQQQTGGGMKLRFQPNPKADVKEEEAFSHLHQDAPLNRVDGTAYKKPKNVDTEEANSELASNVEGGYNIEVPPPDDGISIDEGPTFPAEAKENAETFIKGVKPFADPLNDILGEPSIDKTPDTFSFGFSMNNLSIDQLFPTNESPSLLRAEEIVDLPDSPKSSTLLQESLAINQEFPQLNEKQASPEELLPMTIASQSMEEESTPPDEHSIKSSDAKPSVAVYENPFLDKLRLDESHEFDASEKDVLLNENVAMSNVLNNKDYEVISQVVRLVSWIT